MPARQSACAPAMVAPSLSPDDRADLRFLRIRYEHLARHGCGWETCPPATCLEARQARLLLRAIDALEVTADRTP